MPIFDSNSSAKFSHEGEDHVRTCSARCIALRPRKMEADSKPLEDDSLAEFSCFWAEVGGLLVGQ